MPQTLDETINRLRNAIDQGEALDATLDAIDIIFSSLPTLCPVLPSFDWYHTLLETKAYASSLEFDPLVAWGNEVYEWLNP